jgi:methionyl-tRNA formyltransferase
MDRIKVLYCGYREWSLDLYRNFRSNQGSYDVDVVATQEEFLNKNHNLYEFILFIGWSWVIPKEIVESVPCICMHPSKLPRYRGGSPLQHQIINGETKSAVTLFIMNDKVDAGDIISQRDFSLEGELEDIMNRMKLETYYSLNLLFHDYKETRKIRGVPQYETCASTYKRRTPAQSEITLEEIQGSTASELYHKIRALQAPYPNAFIKCKDRKLFITKARIE